MIGEQTTIRVNKSTKNLLESFKTINQEPMEQVLRNIIGLAAKDAVKTYEIDNETKNNEWVDDEGKLNPNVIRVIKERLENLRRGEVISTKEMRERLLS